MDDSWHRDPLLFQSLALWYLTINIERQKNKHESSDETFLLSFVYFFGSKIRLSLISHLCLMFPVGYPPVGSKDNRQTWDVTGDQFFECRDVDTISIVSTRKEGYRRLGQESSRTGKRLPKEKPLLSLVFFLFLDDLNLL